MEEKDTALGRIASGQTKGDNYVDLAGYAACAGEIALNEQKPVADIPTTDEPVEPWGDEDDARSDNICHVSDCSTCVFPDAENGRHSGDCITWMKSNPAEARKIMGEWEAEHGN